MTMGTKARLHAKRQSGTYGWHTKVLLCRVWLSNTASPAISAGSSAAALASFSSSWMCLASLLGSAPAGSLCLGVQGRCMGFSIAWCHIGLCGRGIEPAKRASLDSSPHTFAVLLLFAGSLAGLGKLVPLLKDALVLVRRWLHGVDLCGLQRPGIPVITHPGSGLPAASLCCKMVQHRADLATKEKRASIAGVSCSP